MMVLFYSDVLLEMILYQQIRYHLMAPEASKLPNNPTQGWLGRDSLSLTPSAATQKGHSARRPQHAVDGHSREAPRSSLRRERERPWPSGRQPREHHRR